MQWITCAATPSLCGEAEQADEDGQAPPSPISRPNTDSHAGERRAEGMWSWVCIVVQGHSVW